MDGSFGLRGRHLEKDSRAAVHLLLEAAEVAAHVLGHIKMPGALESNARGVFRCSHVDAADSLPDAPVLREEGIGGLRAP